MRRLLALGLALICSACTSVHYALQAGAGEFELLSGARPIDEFLQRGDTPDHLRRLLTSVGEVKAFGESRGLRPTASYQWFERLDRPVAVYVVSACPELSLQPKLFRFPIAGAVPYLGWFKLRAAQDFKRTLEKEGLEVDLRGASTFSTLGFFNDPLLSSMIDESPAGLGQLVNTVIHESVHATLYLAGQTPFNEGLAEAVADRLSGEYLAAHAAPFERFAWQEEQARRARIEAALHAAAERLDALYRSNLSDDEKRARKREEMSGLVTSLQLRRPVNNAFLAEHRAYAAGRAGFDHLLDACAEDLRCMFGELRKLDAASFARPNDDAIDPLLDSIADRVKQRR